MPAVFLEGLPELGGQQGFFFFRLDPIAQHDHANSYDTSPLVNGQGAADRGQIESGINGMPEMGVGPRADEFMVLFESDSAAPKLSQVPAGPQRDREADPGEGDGRNGKSVGSMHNAVAKNADRTCVAEDQYKPRIFRSRMPQRDAKDSWLTVLRVFSAPTAQYTTKTIHGPSMRYRQIIDCCPY